MGEMNFDFQGNSKSNHAIKIMNRIEVPIYGDITDGKKDWWFDWAFKDPTGTNTHVVNGYNVLKAIQRVVPDIHSCSEYFGGAGVQALMCEELFDLKEHLIGELSTVAFEHLKKLFREKKHVEIVYQDAYKVEIRPSDLIIIDFPDCTLKRLMEDKQRELLDKCFATRPKALVFTDVAGIRFGLQKARYSKMAGRELENYLDYLHFIVEKIKEFYGYNLVECRYARFCSLFGFVAQDVGEGKFIEKMKDEKGLEILY